MNITTTTGQLMIWASFAASLQTPITAIASEIDFQVVVDGVALAGAAMFEALNSQPESGAIVRKTAGLGAGVHTVLLQWRVVGGGSARVGPVAAPGSEHASLLAMEVSV